MIMIKLILMAAAVLAIVVGTISNIQETQAKYIDNHHSHSDIDNLKGNEGGVTNCSDCFDNTGSPVEKYHSNFNDNTNRPVGADGERTNTNSHEIPNGNGNGNGNSDGE
jgi:hypothetical protein